jgi:hypothetical protein
MYNYILPSVHAMPAKHSFKYKKKERRYYMYVLLWSRPQRPYSYEHAYTAYSRCVLVYAGSALSLMCASG